jgi:hypothetical protein
MRYVMLTDAIANTPVIFDTSYSACDAAESADVDFWHYGIVVCDANGIVECEMPANVAHVN